MSQELVDRIYEASFSPQSWPGVLEQLAEAAGARGGAFLASSHERKLRWTSSRSLAEDVEAYVSEGWTLGCPRSKQWFGRLEPSFVIEADIWRPEELDGIPLYREFLRPRGLGWSAGLALKLPTQDRLVFSLEREFDKGPIEEERLRRLEELRPHLARAALMSARLQLERAAAAGEALALLGLPALVFDERGAVLTANTLAQQATDFICWLARGRVALHDRTANGLLQHALEAQAGDDLRALRSFPARAADEAAVVIAHVCPIRRSARDLFVRCAAVMVMTPMTTPEAPPIELLRSLFDLTLAEARMARGLASGATTEEIAGRYNISYHTARTHVRGVLAKTGCSRQAEVVALLAGAALPRM